MNDHAISCFFLKHPELLTTRNRELIEKVAEEFLVQGVKIGGLYYHYKGETYIVTNVCRDADDWSRWRVEYASVLDGTHKASRFLDDFLGVVEKDRKRFILVN